MNPLITSILFYTSLSLIILLVIRNRKTIGAQLKNAFAGVLHFFNPQRREAMLNYVICEHCRIGKGVINPIYRILEGKPHVLGTCNYCGRYISAPLR